MFDRDTRGRSTCTGACAAAWPPFLTAGRPVAARGVPAAFVGTTRRSDGRLQVTFRGRPLYFFAEDRAAGRVAGASVAGWAAISPAGAKLRPQPAAATTTTPAPPSYTGGGGGY